MKIYFIPMLLASSLLISTPVMAGPNEDLLNGMATIDNSMIEKAILRGANPNLKDKDGNTPLYHAAMDDNINLIKLLLAKGAEPRLKGGNLIGGIVAYSNVETLKFLLSKSASPNERDQNGTPPLFTLLECMDCANNVIPKINLLLNYGADPKAKDNYGRNVLMRFEYFDSYSADLSGRTEADTRTPEQWEEFKKYHMYQVIPSIDVFKLFLAKGVDPNSKDNQGETVLMSAVRASTFNEFSERKVNTEIVKLLLSKGADVRAKNNQGETVLMAAAQGGSTEVIKLLLEKGADIKVAKTDGSTALTYAFDAKKWEAASLLLERGADPNSKIGTIDKDSLIEAARAGQVTVIQFIFSKGFDPQQKDNGGSAALLAAAGSGHNQVVEIFLNKGFEPNSKDADGNTLLSLAAQNGALEVVKLLLSKGANINANYFYGWTPLMSASWNGHLEVVRYLLDKGADHKMKRNDGMTSVMLAASSDHLDVLQLLIAKGADHKAKNEDGKTALDLARQYSLTAIVNYLEKLK